MQSCRRREPHLRQWVEMEFADTWAPSSLVVCADVLVFSPLASWDTHLQNVLLFGTLNAIALHQYDPSGGRRAPDEASGFQLHPSVVFMYLAGAAFNALIVRMLTKSLRIARFVREEPPAAATSPAAAEATAVPASSTEQASLETEAHSTHSKKE